MAIEPVAITFQAHGVSEVLRAFKTVEDAVVRGDAAQTQSVRRGARDRLSEQEKSLRAELREVEKATKDRIRFERQAEREVDGIRRNAVRAVAQAEAEKNREAMKWVREREREEIASERRKAAAREQFARAIGGATVRGVSAGMSTVSRLSTGLIGAAMQAGGGFSVADAVSTRLSLGRNSAMLANSAAIAGQSIPAQYQMAGDPGRVDPAKVESRARATGIKYGLDPNDVIQGAQSYVAKSSDFKGGMENMDFFAKVAAGTGAKFGDVMGMAGQMRSQNPDLDAGMVKQMVLNTIKQGGAGSVEIPDLAKAGGQITRMSAVFGGDQATTQNKLLGLSQIAVKGAGSASGAATALGKFASDAVLNAGRIGGVTDKNGQLLDVEKVISRVFEKSNGNIGTMMGRDAGHLGFSKSALNFLAPLAQTYNTARDKATGSEADKKKAGLKAVQDQVGGITKATMNEGDLDKLVSQALNTPAAALEKAMNELKDKVGTEVVPELVKLVPVIKDMTPAIVSILSKGIPQLAKFIEGIAKFVSAHQGMLDSIASNPIGSIMAFEVSKSIASAGLGALFKSLLSAAMGGGKGGGGGSPVSGVGGAAAAGALALGAATGKNIIAGADAGEYVQNITAKIKAGEISPEAGQKMIADAKARREKSSIFTDLGNSLLSPIMDSADRDNKQRERDEALTGTSGIVSRLFTPDESSKLTKAISDAVVAGVKDGAGKSNPNDASRSGSMATPQRGGGT